MMTLLLLLIVSCFSPAVPVSFGLIATVLLVYGDAAKPARWMLLATLAGFLEDIMYARPIGLLSAYLLGLGLVMSLTQSVLTLRTRWLALLFVMAGEIMRRILWQLGWSWDLVFLSGILAGVGLVLFRFSRADEAVYLKD